MEPNQNQYERSVVQTNDGSSSIFVPELDEHYHSVHGAIQESNHVFIERGLNQVKSKQVNILEVGFGTGLNCLLSCHTLRVINYHGVEAYPVANNLIEQLNYAKATNDNADIFKAIHSAPWQSYQQISPTFYLFKDATTIENIVIKEKYHLIYFDAFGPKVQVELWCVEVFEKLYKSLISGGILVTYCAKGQVRRDLQSVGFSVERLPGPPGKREMLRGIKK